MMTCLLIAHIGVSWMPGWKGGTFRNSKKIFRPRTNIFFYFLIVCRGFFTFLVVLAQGVAPRHPLLIFPNINLIKWFYFYFRKTTLRFVSGFCKQSSDINLMQFCNIFKTIRIYYFTHSTWFIKCIPYKSIANFKF